MRSIIVLAALTLSSPALAAMSPATAQLAAPARVAAVVTGTGLWRCEGSTCSGQTRGDVRQAGNVCAEIAGEAGRVAAFTVGGTAFTDDDLVRCNRRVKP